MGDTNTPMILVSDERTRTVYFREKHPEDMWKDVFDNDAPVIGDLFVAIKKSLSDYGWNTLYDLAAFVLNWTIYFQYRNQTEYFARNTKIGNKRIMTDHQMAIAQRMYTVAHFKGTSGCSTAVFWDDQNNEMVCLRSLDWSNAEALGKATRTFRFSDGNKTVYEAAGVAGMVGILTALKKGSDGNGGFGIAINYAPWSTFAASLNPDPTFYVRRLLEDEDITTYQQAKQEVTHWTTGAPVFITLCGPNQGEACVVEFGTSDKVPWVREMKNNILVQTNHFDLQESPFSGENPEQLLAPPDSGDWSSVKKVLKHSQFRREQLEKTLVNLMSTPGSNGGISDQHFTDTYSKEPVWNFETAQWALIRPAKGTMSVWARSTP